MARIIDFAAPVGQKAGTGHWNDLDMLEIGNGGMTFDEYGVYYIFGFDTIIVNLRYEQLRISQCGQY